MNPSFAFLVQYTLSSVFDELKNLAMNGSAASSSKMNNNSSHNHSNDNYDIQNSSSSKEHFNR